VALVCDVGPFDETGWLQGYQRRNRLDKIAQGSGQTAFGWRAGVDELRPFTQDLWRAANATERSGIFSTAPSASAAASRHAVMESTVGSLGKFGVFASQTVFVRSLVMKTSHPFRACKAALMSVRDPRSSWRTMCAPRSGAAMSAS
jgi:hypothetical protein